MVSRPRFQPSPDHPKLVRRLAACGQKQEDIARMVGVRSPKTLRKYFREELDRSAIEANTNVAHAVYKEAIAGDIAAAKLWMAWRGGWRENKDANTRSAAPPFIVVRSKEPK